MPSPTETKIELSHERQRVWVLGGVVLGLMVLVQGFFTYTITSTGAELRETNRGLVELVSTVKVHQSELQHLLQAKKDADAVHKTIDQRLNSLEQRAAVHDQWIAAHNH